MKKGYNALLAEAEAEIETVPVGQALSLHGQDGVVFVDLRDPREIQREGRIPGSFHCPRGMLEFWVDPESPYAKPVFAEPKRFLFYCASGWRSARTTPCSSAPASPVSTPRSARPTTSPTPTSRGWP